AARPSPSVPPVIKTDCGVSLIFLFLGKGSLYAPQPQDASTRLWTEHLPRPDCRPATCRRYQSLSINCSTLMPASRKILRRVPKAISSCNGTVTGSFFVSVG